MLLAYLMMTDAEERNEAREVEVRNQMFGHAFVNQNPELYAKLFPDAFGPQGLTPEEEEDIEWQVPRSMAEAQALLAELGDITV